MSHFKCIRFQFLLQKWVFLLCWLDEVVYSILTGLMYTAHTVWGVQWLYQTLLASHGRWGAIQDIDLHISSMPWLHKACPDCLFSLLLLLLCFRRHIQLQDKWKRAARCLAQHVLIPHTGWLHTYLRVSWTSLSTFVLGLHFIVVPLPASRKNIFSFVYPRQEIPPTSIYPPWWCSS